MAEEEVVVHGVRSDPGYVSVRELDEGVVLALAGALVAREAEASDFAELGKVGAHLVFIEAVRDAAEVDDAGD